MTAIRCRSLGAWTDLGFTATLLTNGHVLVAGGPMDATADLYEP
jgi:hypothetical protein